MLRPRSKIGGFFVGVLVGVVIVVLSQQIDEIVQINSNLIVAKRESEKRLRRVLATQATETDVPNACRAALAAFKGVLNGTTIADATTACSACLAVDRDLHHACLAMAWREFADMFLRRGQRVQTFSVGWDPNRATERTTWISGQDAPGTKLTEALASHTPGHENHIERANWNVVNTVIIPNCVDAARFGKRPLVVVVGANEGYYAFASSGGGCRTMLFEPQGGCVPWLLLDALRSKHVEPMDIRVNSVNSFPIQFDTGNSCDGGAQYTANGELTNNPDNVRPWKHHEDTAMMTARSVRLDEVINEDIELLLVDVEGAEVLVLESATAIFSSHAVRHAVIEWQPQRFQTYGIEWEDGAERGAKVAQKGMWECRRMTPDDGLSDSLDPKAVFVRCLPGLTEMFNANFGEDM